jgi:SAM-dependent methyltransferase
MHDTAAAFGVAFFRCYADAFEEARILEVGAGDVNGTLRGCAPRGSRYTGIDLEAGPGVDVVLSDPYTYPFKSATYDVVVSSSCLEHDQMFWLTFAEMCRVLRAGGFIYLNVPSNGWFHRYPTDNWRFYPDSGLALAAWGRRNGHDIHLVESFIGRRRRDIWNDCILVFGKGDTPRQLSLLAELFPRSFNIRVGEREIISNYCESTEDMTLRAWLAGKLESLSPSNGNDDQASPIEALIVSLAEREVALDATVRAAAERSTAAEAQIAALRAELDHYQAQHAEAVRECDDRGAALAAVRVELSTTQSILGERDAALQRAEAEAADLRTALDERVAALQRAEAEVADLRTVLDERVAALQQTEGKISERDAAFAMLQSELVAVRAELAEQHAAATELNAARQALVAGVEQHEALLTTARHELEELEGLRLAAQERADALATALVVARKVGKAVLQALTIDTSVMPPGERSGWLHSIKRQFGLPE